ncbi:MAG: 2-phosphosulfolactate phosphatase [Candidatus Eremiobacteraeota bacterium]|nr:2-phosphosulfolactate phosphatase [Candidatus Eremiobacteraeota bacterium]
MRRTTELGVHVEFEWGLRGLEACADGTDIVVVVDVLSFSTAVSIAIERGATIIPYRFDYESARLFSEQQNALLAVRRRDASKEDPYSLSPASLRSLPEGSRFVLPSPNGSTCCARAVELGVEHVFVGSLRNARATANAAQLIGGRIAVIAAGEQWDDGSLRPALEDYIGAGAIVSALDPPSVSPEAAVAMWSYRKSKGDLKTIIRNCMSGRELIEWGYGDDVEIALEVDDSSMAAILRGPEIIGSD